MTNFEEFTQLKLTIDLSKEQSEQIQNLAKSLSIQPKDLIQAVINDLLSQRSEDFRQVADHVLKKNRELYKRLG